jgi:hypothetical protein
MRRVSPFVLVIATMAFCGVTAYQGECEAAAGERIKLRVLYAGHPGSDRERDFVAFLEEHFTKVGKGDLPTFKAEWADDYDVVIMDYDGDPFDLRRPRLSKEYTRPTVTVGMAGALICNPVNVKTRYL